MLGQSIKHSKGYRAPGHQSANQRVLFLVHRRELVQRASRKLYDVGLDHGIIAAGFPARPDAWIQVASISALHRRAGRGVGGELRRDHRLAGASGRRQQEGGGGRLELPSRSARRRPAGSP
jgi:hypothetical protein